MDYIFIKENHVAFTQLAVEGVLHPSLRRYRMIEILTDKRRDVNVVGVAEFSSHPVDKVYKLISLFIELHYRGRQKDLYGFQL